MGAIDGVLREVQVRGLVPVIKSSESVPVENNCPPTRTGKPDARPVDVGLSDV